MPHRKPECGECGTCAACIARARRTARRALGVCSCGRPRIGGRATCERCYERGRIKRGRLPVVCALDGTPIPSPARALADAEVVFDWPPDQPQPVTVALKRVDCVHYDACTVRVALGCEHWPQFDCGQCRAYVQKPITRAELDRAAQVRKVAV